MKITLQTIDKVYKTKPVSDETMELMGYEFIENLFVDSSGFGQTDEPALTQDQFEIRLTELLEQYGTLYTSIRGAGMFQVNMGVWTRTGKKIARRLSTNVLLINDDSGNKIYRLYDTDIVTFTSDNKMILNHGGYETITTSKWMNKYIPTGRVYRRNWQMYYNDLPIPLEGLTVQL